MSNFAMKANAKTSKEYIINAVNYTLTENIEVVPQLHVKIS
jgi:hypothetical protein